MILSTKYPLEVKLINPLSYLLETTLRQAQCSFLNSMSLSELYAKKLKDWDYCK